MWHRKQEEELFAVMQLLGNDNDKRAIREAHNEIIRLQQKTRNQKRNLRDLNRKIQFWITSAMLQINKKLVLQERMRNYCTQGIEVNRRNNELHQLLRKNNIEVPHENETTL